MADDPTPPPSLFSSLWSEFRAVCSLFFDFSFKKFVTPRIVRTLYSLNLFAAFLGSLAWMGSGFRESFLWGIVTVCTGPIALVIYVLLARVTLELIIAIFRIAENLEKQTPPRQDGKL
jgi:hypothetical protein